MSVNFNQTGGFPLDTNILDFMQDEYKIFNNFCSLTGNAILSGCVDSGSSVTDGVVVVSGEVMPFKGGVKSGDVIVVEDKTKLRFENGEVKDVEIRKYAKFGVGSISYKWGDFYRVKPIWQIENTSVKEDDAIKKRLDKVEDLLKKIVPIGTIAIWNRPANIPIPMGWKECTDFAGRMPVGVDVDDSEFGVVGKVGGEKDHTLTVEEMPRHNHKHDYIFDRLVALGKDLDGITVGDFDKTDNGGRWQDGYAEFQPFQSAPLKDAGGGQPHNNMPPYRVVKFIEFIGFE